MDMVKEGCDENAIKTLIYVQTWFVVEDMFSKFILGRREASEVTQSMKAEKTSVVQEAPRSSTPIKIREAPFGEKAE